MTKKRLKEITHELDQMYLRVCEIKEMVDNMKIYEKPKKSNR